MEAFFTMSQNNPKDWRELCRKAAEEFDPDKLMDLIVELNQVLDEQVRKRKGMTDDATASDAEAESKQFAAIPTLRVAPRHPVAQNSSFRFAQESNLA
jgi:hypothetical protein